MILLDQKKPQYKLKQIKNHRNYNLVQSINSDIHNQKAKIISSCLKN